MFGMPLTDVKFVGTSFKSDPSQVPVSVIGKCSNLRKVSWKDVSPHLEQKVSESVWKKAVQSLSPAPTDTCGLWMSNANVGGFSDKVSRHNMPSSAYHIPKLLRSCLTGKGDQVVVIVCEESEVFACGCAIARSYPLFTMRTDGGKPKRQRTLSVEFVIVGEKTCDLKEIAACLQDTADSVRLAAKIVDMPCNIMNTTAFVNEAKEVGEELGIVPMVIQGEDLDKQGFGGIYGVGKASEHPPALVVLSHYVPNATLTIAWCGKGIVYDTGGLSIKGKTTMPGMKRDCGGAAAVLSAFRAAVKRGFKQNLHAVLCLAENSVGPIATRPDDIHILYSGRSVEINNTDAEGRLVLGDGVAYASKDLRADIILDMATLTGAQGVSTGKYHAAILTNNEKWERIAMEAGKKSGDLTHPLVYCPELHFSEFNSAVADMKNSVADRSNAQSSCAGLFIGSHLQGAFSFPGTWIHVDMASPAHCGERATGYGVALLLTLFGQNSEDKLLQLIAPSDVSTGGVDYEDGLDENSIASKRPRNA
uniref:Probable aminopeptidase NPEPL1 n=1 Tax=Phallusia mammillata TaxID=59560 RepID=A0A6F9DN08_9ASCI|nr:probable aminopeptidase NPEPL1 [Phallusia mammillata]